MLIPTTIPIVPPTQDTRHQVDGYTDPGSGTDFAQYLARSTASGEGSGRSSEAPSPPGNTETSDGMTRGETAPGKRSAPDAGNPSGEPKTIGDAGDDRRLVDPVFPGEKRPAKRLAAEDRRVGDDDERPGRRTGKDHAFAIGDESAQLPRVPEGPAGKRHPDGRKGSRTGDPVAGATERAIDADRAAPSEHPGAAATESVGDASGVGEENINRSSRADTDAHGENIPDAGDEDVAVDHLDDVTRLGPVSESPDAAGSRDPLVATGDAGQSTQEKDPRHRREGDDDRRTPRGRLEALRSAHGPEQTAPAASADGEQIRSDRSEGPIREIIVDLSPEGPEESTLSQQSPITRPGNLENTLAHGGARFVPQAQLARRLNGELGRSIVRQANVMLRDAGRGEIRLVIRPPELGRVRINLQMDNGHIAGRILVDNGSVREVFEQNLGALQRAFAEAGLELGDLEISTGGEQRQDNGGDERPGRPRRVASDRFDTQVEPLVRYEYGGRHINLVA